MTKQNKEKPSTVNDGATLCCSNPGEASQNSKVKTPGKPIETKPIGFSGKLTVSLY
jgi:hypothetical protein